MNTLVVAYVILYCLMILDLLGLCPSIVDTILDIYLVLLSIYILSFK